MKWCTVIVIFSCIWCVSCDDAASDVSTTTPLNAPVQPPVDDTVQSTVDAPVQPTVDAPVQPPVDAPVQPTVDAPVQPPVDGPANNTSSEESDEEADQTEVLKLKKECLENADLATFERAVSASWITAQCLGSYINDTAIIAEMGVAKELKDLKAVFEKQCGFVPQLRECVGNFTAARGPCFNATYRVSHTKAIHDVIGGLLDSACFNEGERLALFFANGGPACIDEQSMEILKCVRPTTAHLASEKELSVLSFGANLIKGAIYCIPNYRDVQTCVVGKLAVCRSPVIGSLVDSLLNDIYTVMPCANRTDSQV